MKVWQVALLVVYFAGNLSLYIRLRKKPAPLSSDFVPGWKRPWIAIFWMWGPTLWPLPGLCWLGGGDLFDLSVIFLSFCLPLIFFFIFFALMGAIPFSRFRDRAFLIGTLFLPVSLTVLGFFFLVGSLMGELTGVQFVLFLTSISLIPLFSILLMVLWPMFIIPLEPGTAGLVPQTIRMVIGHFTSYPGPAWQVEEGQIQARVKGNSFLGTGPGWLLTEPENLVVLKRGPQMTRLAGPGAILTERGESPFKVVDLRNQIRSTQVTGVTKDGVEVRFSISSLFRIDPKGATVKLKEPWPYDEDHVWDAVFVESVEPTGRTPLEANRAHPWQELPLRIAVQKAKQAIGFYTFDQLYQDGSTSELVDVHRRVEEAFALDPSDAVVKPLARQSIGNLVQRAVRKQLEPKGFDIFGGGIGSTIEPLSEEVVAQRVEDWKARFVKQIADWQSGVEQLRIENQGKIRASRTDRLLDLVEAVTTRTHEIQLRSDAIAYWIIDSLMQITSDPAVRKKLPESSMKTLEDLSAWNEAQDQSRSRR